MRILLLEDEESIRGFLRINLKRNDLEVTEAENGEDALRFARTEGPFDIALLDVMLPTISGFEVCKQLRNEFPAMGIIMLTAKSQEEDKIQGLELGADDYIQKPFSPGELIARIKSLHRRMSAVRQWAPDPSSQAFANGNGETAAQGAAPSANGFIGHAENGTATGGTHVADRNGLGRMMDGNESGASNGPDQRRIGEVEQIERSNSELDRNNAERSGAELDRNHAGRSNTDLGRNHAEQSSYGQASTTGAGSDHFSARKEQHYSEVGSKREAAQEQVLHSGPFRLSLPERKLWKDEQEIVLTPTEWTLVRLLMERQGTSVSRDQILSDVWGRYYVGDLKVVDVNIRRIRQKIESNPSSPSVIETVWGYGYRWKRSART